MQNIENIRHSLSHLLAAAVLQKFPKTQFGIGPVIENGFYYDFLLPEPLKPEDLKELEATMRDLIKQNLPFVGKEVTIAEAKKLFQDQPFKLELIKDLSKESKTVSIYITGKPEKPIFIDLCRGGHVKNTKEINPETFTLENIAGAYWRGNEKNKMLTRIYGLAFETKKELDNYLALVEEAKKRDHRKMGKLLDLFTLSDLIGSGLPLYTPKGTIIRRALNDYIESLQTKAGYTQVWTPQIAKAELFKKSGHYDKYRDGMFRVISNYSEEEFYLKPMNCPQHTQIYKSQSRSYRDLPLRYSDFAMLYRDEKPGELNGLARVRSFSQDDCHIFCREDQVDQEIDTALSMIKKVMATFGFKYRYRLSTRDKNHPEKYLGDPKTWNRVEKWAEEIMKRNKIDYFEAPGEAAFYAPKMDLMATDALGREWQLSTVQIDFVMPQRFNLIYKDKDGKEKNPVMIHRAIIGSPERFIMVLLEHYAGSFPTWLAPIQVKVLAVSEKQEKYAKEITEKMKGQGIRVELMDSNETLGKRIREAELLKIPYIVVVGDRETKEKLVNIRERQKKETKILSLKEFLEKIKKEIEEKSR
ncbi:MAG: threonine--tRNA ligase [Patescibacteria group bacterium]|nr:threonine--tRNA ligase [Patescibacteria group bacterium]